MNIRVCSMLTKMVEPILPENGDDPEYVVNGGSRKWLCSIFKKIGVFNSKFQMDTNDIMLHLQGSGSTFSAEKSNK